MRPRTSRGKLAFVDTSIVDVERGEVVEHQTVVVDGPRIVGVGPTSTTDLPPGTKVVSRSEGFLAPGLADLHVHLGGEAEMLLLLLSGVTTVRNMWGFARHLTWREAIEEGRMLGPTLYTTGPIVDGSPPVWNLSVPLSTPEQAVEEVRRQKSAGFSAVKVYGHLSAPVYAAIVGEAAAQGLPVVGHVPREVQLAGALAAHQRSIEHLEGMVEAVQSDTAPWKGRPMTDAEYARAGEFLDPALVPRVAQAIADSQSWSCPTLVVWESFASPEQVAERMARPAMRLCPPSLLAGWDPSRDFRLKSRPKSFWDSLPAIGEGRRSFVRALRYAGARVVIGTDTPNPWVVPGSSLHDEMDRFVDCGYSVPEVLRMSTHDAAVFLGAPGEFGRIAPGARADLLLVEGNPLEQLAYLRHPRGVMVRGRWLPQRELERISGALLRSYATGRRRTTVAAESSSHSDVAGGRTYTIESFGVHYGMERIWKSESHGESGLHATLPIDAPPGVTTVRSDWTLAGSGEPRLVRSRFEFFEGRESVVIRRQRTGFAVRHSQGAASGGQTGPVSARRDALLGPVQVATLLPVTAALRSLAPGESIERDVVRIDVETVQVASGTVTVKRLGQAPEPSSPTRQYSLEEKWTNGRFSGSLELSAEGEILSLRWLPGVGELVWAPAESAGPSAETPPTHTRR